MIVIYLCIHAIVAAFINTLQKQSAAASYFTLQNFLACLASDRFLIQYSFFMSSCPDGHICPPDQIAIVIATQIKNQIKNQIKIRSKIIIQKSYFKNCNSKITGSLCLCGLTTSRYRNSGKSNPAHLRSRLRR